MTWVDDCVVSGHGHHTVNNKEKMRQLFDCDDFSELKEYIGHKVDNNKKKGIIRLTQPVIIQSFKDEFSEHPDAQWATLALTG